jgi:hypothetical protein
MPSRTRWAQPERWAPAVIPALTAITFLIANLVARLLERTDA